MGVGALGVACVWVRFACSRARCFARGTRRDWLCLCVLNRNSLAFEDAFTAIQALAAKVAASEVSLTDIFKELHPIVEKVRRLMIEQGLDKEGISLLCAACHLLAPVVL